MTVDLTALIREVRDEDGEPDPFVLSERVLGRIAGDDVGQALAETLPYMVRAELRRSAPSFLPPREATSPRRDHAPHGTLSHGVAAGPSKKITAAREAWRAWRDQPLYVGGGVHKRLGDCTRIDLVAAAERREEHARRTWARAAQLRQLITLLDEHHVDQVGHLADSLTQSVFETRESA